MISNIYGFDYDVTFVKAAALNCGQVRGIMVQLGFAREVLIRLLQEVTITEVAIDRKVRMEK